MAEYKMVDAQKLDADLTAVAEAIRERAGTTEEMEFPDGFKSVVRSIPDYLAAKCMRTLTDYHNSDMTNTGTYPFTECTSLKKVSFPQVTSLGYMAFSGCTSLEEVHLPKATTTAYAGFQNCKALKILVLPSVTSVSSLGFNGSAIETLVLGATAGIATLANVNAFTGTPIAKGTGYIYVPSALVDSYKSATNWSTYADRFRAIEDYPDIVGG